MKDAIIDLYKSLGLLEPTGDSLPLHECCELRRECWDGAEDRYPPSAYNNGWPPGISRPWVGSRYKELRILAIAINMNGYGGLNAAVELVEGARKEMCEGTRKVFIDPPIYTGTLLYHRLACYTTAIAEAKRLMKCAWCSDGSPAPDEVEPALDFVAYTNQVKCSPKGDLSQPTWGMWKNCGKHILSREMKLLTPEIILVLGTDSNATSFEGLLKSQPEYEAEGKCRSATVAFQGRLIRVFVVPHPGRPRGAACSIIGDFRELVKKVI